MSEIRLVKTHDGRNLAVETTGSSAGFPVFLLHGTPGSRKGPKPRSSVLYRLGVQLISYDRPGFGGSSRDEGRSVASAAHDVAAIADELGIERFAVVGRSGGGPHALACGSLLPKRVTRVAGLVSLARHDAAELDWFVGMNDENIQAYSRADDDPSVLAEQLTQQADMARRDPQSMVRLLLSQMAPPDLRIVSDVQIQRLLANTYAEALKHGPYGWIDDVLALRSDWGFTLDTVKVPVRLWHGAQDNMVPVDHTRWLGRQLPTAEVIVASDRAHFGAVEILPEILAWLVAEVPSALAG